ncbi:MAG: hypothetical protein Crog4KO_01250 [Crocinitomicaceae bacterium]
MKLITLALSFLFTLNGVGQQITRKPVPGTRLTIEIHGDNEIARHAPILNIEDKVDLNIVEMTDSAAYERTKSDLTVKNIQAQGFVIKENREIKVNGYAGRFILVEIGTSEYGFSCYFGDATFLAMCTAVYDRSDEVMLSKLLKAVQSIKIDKNQSIDWNSFLSFRYNPESIFQLDSSQNHNLGIRFTANAVAQTNMFDRTMIMCMQAPPTNQTFSAEDVINRSLVPQLAIFEINDVMEDGQETLNNTDSYIFNGDCTMEGKDFEIYSRAFFHESAIVLISAYIINGEDETAAKAFVDGIRLKKDGL